MPISINRRLVHDGLSFARRVPLFPAEKWFELADVATIRKQVPQRISWAALFVKAYATTARHHPPLRQTYVRWPWPHVVEEPHSTAMVVVNRQYLGEDRICWGRLVHPEEQPLVELQRQLNAYQIDPVERIFRQQLRLSRMPTPVRRALYWLNMNFGGRKRAKRLGTFTMSTLAGQGVLNRMHQTFLTTSLTYGPLDEQGRALVTLLCDHRVVDGMVAARALGELEAVLKGAIATELKSLAIKQTAA
ncbi:MAG: hypothetical protein IT427_07005 [Pirellulales bacterium]|nr:hypothetical protein [Pirellulales bacterium]